MYRSLGRSVDNKPTEEFYSNLSVVSYTAAIHAESSLRFLKLSLSLDGLEDWRKRDVIVVHEETKG